jgi:hypothetical protein
MARGAAPLCTTTFAGKAGVSEPPPQGFEWGDWAKRVAVDVPALRAYAQAVYASTDEYLATLKDADLDRQIDLGSMGKNSLGWLLSIMAGNADMHNGEIACIKGLKGAKGYVV